MKLPQILALSLSLSACGSNPKPLNTPNLSLTYSQLVADMAIKECEDLPGFLKQTLIENQVIIKSIVEEYPDPEINIQSNRPKTQLISFDATENSFVNQFSFRPDSRPAIFVAPTRNSCLSKAIQYHLAKKDYTYTDEQKMQVIYAQVDFNHTMLLDQLVLENVDFILSNFNEMSVRNNLDESKIDVLMIKYFEVTLNNLQSIMEFLSLKGETFPVQLEPQLLDFLIYNLHINLDRLHEITKFVIHQGETPMFIEKVENGIAFFTNELKASIANTRFETIELEALKYLVSSSTLDRRIYREGFEVTVLNYFAEIHPEFKR